MHMKTLLTTALAVVLTTSTALAAQGDFKVIRGTMVEPKSVLKDDTTSKIVVKAEDGKTYDVAIDQATRAQSSIMAGEKISVVGHEGRQPTQINAYLIDTREIDASRGSAASPAAATGDWKRVHGRVEKVDGSTLTFKADDGRTLVVDMSQVGQNIQRALTPGEGATVVGFAGAQANAFTARYIQQDSSDPSRGGTIVGRTSAPSGVDEKSWQRIHGTVQQVDGTTLKLKTDEGKVLTVDMAEVGANIRSALKPGEGVTVAGFYRGDREHVAARFIQQDSSNPARGGSVVSPSASPKSGK